jgi:hypothetical protein
MKLSPICWAAAFSAALPCRRALRRGSLAGTGAVPGGGGTGRSWARWGLRVGELKPPLAILGDGAPAVRTSELCFYTLLLEGVVQCSAKGHLGALGGPRVGHPAREGHARQSGHGHARDVPSPLGKSVVVVAANGVEAKALVKGFRFDVVADVVSHGDTAH